MITAATFVLEFAAAYAALHIGAALVDAVIRR